MIGAAVCAFAFFGVSIGVGAGMANPDNHAPGIIATVFIWLYFSSFSSGWISVPWLYPAEVNSLKFRTKGAALATACDWLFNYAVVQTTPPGIHHLKWGLYLIYALFNVAFVPLVYYFVVETQGKSLEQTDRWFEQNQGWFVHTADHTAGGFSSGRGGGRGFAPLKVADDHEAMMRAFEVGEEDEHYEVVHEDSDSVSVTRRGSFPLAGEN